MRQVRGLDFKNVDWEADQPEPVEQGWKLCHVYFTIAGDERGACASDFLVLDEHHQPIPAVAEAHLQVVASRSHIFVDLVRLRLNSDGSPKLNSLKEPEKYTERRIVLGLHSKEALNARKTEHHSARQDTESVGQLRESVRVTREEVSEHLRVSQERLDQLAELAGIS